MNSKPVIVHLISALDKGGCENQLLRLLPTIEEYNHIIITLRHEGTLAPQFKSIGITIKNCGMRSWFDVRAYRQLLKLLEQLHPTLIMTYLFHADMIGRLIILPMTGRRPVPSLRTTYNDPRYRLARLVELITKPLVKRYHAVSVAVKDYYIEEMGVKADKITVIPNGIDLEHYDQIEPSRTLLINLGIKSTDTVLICVANLHSYKGHRYLLEAFEQIVMQNANTHLLIVGKGEDERHLKQQLSTFISQKNVHFLGQRTDVPHLLALSDIFVLPTLFEGMSNALLEAMAAHLPIITTDIPENRALLEHRKTGLLVPVKDSGALTNAMLALLANEALSKQLANAAWDYAQKNFSFDVIVEKWKRFYHEV